MHRHVLERGVVLEHEAHPARARGRVRDVLLADLHLALSGLSRPAMIRSSVDLPLPLGPSSAVSAPSSTRDADVVERDELAEALAHVAHLDRHQTVVLLRVRRVSRFIATSVASASSASTTAAV